MSRLFFALLLFLYPGSPVWGFSFASAPLSSCPGPASIALPAATGGPPSGSDLRALLLVARTVRDMPGRRSVGEAALVRAGREIGPLLAARPGDATLHALAGERDLLMVQYRGFPGGMPWGKKAQAQNDRALALDPRNPEARLAKGIELYFKPWFVGGSVSKALVEFERANALRPGDPRILSWIGIARHRLGRPDSRRFLEAALKICPESPFYRARARTFDPRASHR